MTSKSLDEETFLSGLTIDQQGELESRARLYSCPKGTQLFSEGQLPQRAFILLEGQVSLSVNSHDGKRLMIGTAQEGEVLGLASVLNRTRYEISGETQYNCQILTINHGDFLLFLSRHPSALRSVALSLSKSFNQACTRLRTLSGSPSCKAKIARLLLEFSEASRQGEMQFHLALNHQEIGDWVGMSRESVTRVLNVFRRRGLIAQKGTWLEIKDRVSLERLAGERRKCVRTGQSNRNTAAIGGADTESLEKMIDHITAVLQQHNIGLPNLSQQLNWADQ